MRQVAEGRKNILKPQYLPNHHSLCKFSFFFLKCLLIPTTFPNAILAVDKEHVITTFTCITPSRSNLSRFVPVSSSPSRPLRPHSRTRLHLSQHPRASHSNSNCQSSPIHHVSSLPSSSLLRPTFSYPISSPTLPVFQDSKGSRRRYPRRYSSLQQRYQP